MLYKYKISITRNSDCIYELALKFWDFRKQTTIKQYSAINNAITKLQNSKPFKFHTSEYEICFFGYVKIDSNFASMEKIINIWCLDLLYYKYISQVASATSSFTTLHIFYFHSQKCKFSQLPMLLRKFGSRYDIIVW